MAGPGTGEKYLTGAGPKASLFPQLFCIGGIKKKLNHQGQV
jgi:hypothetical protein